VGLAIAASSAAGGSWLGSWLSSYFLTIHKRASNLNREDLTRMEGTPAGQRPDGISESASLISGFAI
jgi:hypothetical protein